MQLLYRVRPTRLSRALKRPGDQLMAIRVPRSTEFRKEFYKQCQRTIELFDSLPVVNDRQKPRVGALVRFWLFHPTANNELVKVESGRVAKQTFHGLVDFFCLSLMRLTRISELGTTFKSA